MNGPERLFTEEERARDRDALLAARAAIDAQIAYLDSQAPTVERWEVRYVSLSDSVGRVDHTFGLKDDAVVEANRGNRGAVFGDFVVTPRLVGGVAVAANNR